MSVYKRGSVWWISYYHNGKQIREGVSGSRREAERALEARKTDIRRGEFRHIPKRELVTFPAAIAEYKLEKAGKRSLRRDETSFRRLSKAFGFKRLDQITTKDVEAYKRKRAGEVSVATTNRELALLKCLFNIEIGNARVSHNPVKAVKLFPEPPKPGGRVFTSQQFWDLLQAAAPHLKPILVVALFTGLRKNDILTLRRETLDLENGVIRLMMQKTGEPVEIALLPKAVEYLRWFIASRPPGSGAYLFTSHRPGRKTGELTHLTDIKNSFRGAMKRAGLEGSGLCFHDIRGTFASGQYRNGAPLLTVSKLLGHRSVRTTEKYLRVTLEEKRRAVEALGQEYGWILSRFGQASTDHTQVTIPAPVKLLLPAS